MQPVACGDIALRARRKIARRILPFVFVLYIIAYLDRANVAFVSAPMRAELGFSEAVYGFGAGVFFVGYVLLEIPGALIVERWSARRWIARILVTWGVCTILVGAVRTAGQFYAARFLLGMAEAGFFPGIIVYLSHWFRAADRARGLSGFVIAAPVALAIGAPVSALILQLNAFGLPGWRWVFIMEGLPAIVFGAITLFYLTDHPKQAAWLEPAEREWIAGALGQERRGKESAARMRWFDGLRDRNILLLTAAHFCANLAGYGFILWLPNSLQNGLGLPPLVATALSAAPFAAAVAGVIASARSSDRGGERKAHATAVFLAAAAFLALGSVPGQPRALSVLWLVLAGAAAYAWIPPFWVLPTTLLGESAAAASVGLINSIGNLGGFAGPFAVGYLLSRGWRPASAMALLSLAYIGAAGLTACVKTEAGQMFRNTFRNA